MKSSTNIIISLLILCIAVVGGIFYYNRSPFFLPLSNQTTLSSRTQLAQVASATSCSVVCNGLVGYWPFDDGSGTTAVDASGDGNNGMLVNGPAWVAGKIGTDALSFNGTNQEVTAANSSSLSLSGAGTISAWVNLAGAPANATWETVVSKMNFKAGKNGYALDLRGLSGGAKLYLSLGSASAQQNLSGNTVLQAGIWYNIVFTWDGSTLTGYVNGISDTSASETVVPTSSVYGLAVGEDAGPSGSYYFNGTIDDVRIYGRALSASEVSNLYNAAGQSVSQVTQAAQSSQNMSANTETTATTNTSDTLTTNSNSNSSVSSNVSTSSITTVSSDTSSVSAPAAGDLPALNPDNNSSAPVATYWVSPNGQSSWNNCTGQSPQNGVAACSLNTANANVQPGDLVYLRGGTYNGYSITPATSGTAANPIIYSAYQSEDVEMMNQFVPDGSMDSGAWSPISTNASSPTVVWDTSHTFDGTHSTKFTVNDQLQGIVSPSFSIFSNHGVGYAVYACVYSDNQSSVNMVIENGNGSGEAYDQNLTLTPGKWDCTPNLNSAFFGAVAGSQAFIAFRSPKGVTSGTWYVDDVAVSTYEPTIDLDEKSHIRIEGIHVSNAYTGFALVDGSDYDEIADSTFSRIETYAANFIQEGNKGIGSIYNWIHNDVFHDSGNVIWRTDFNECWEEGDQLVIGNDDTADSSSFNLVEDNLFYHAGHSQITINNQYNTVRDNIFHNEDWIRDNYGTCTDSAIARGMFGHRNLSLQRPGYNTLNDDGDNLIEDNRIGYAGIPPSNPGANGIENATDANIIRYNFIYDNGLEGYLFKEQGGASPDPDDNHIYNNTFYKNGLTAGLNGSQGAVGFDCELQYQPEDNVLKNNIFYGNAGTIVGDCAGHGYNPDTLDTIVNNLTSNPLFSDPDTSNPLSQALPDLSLESGSPAINAGTALTVVSPSDSGSGTTLEVDDAGYFQDGTWAPPGTMYPDWIAVGIPTNIVEIFSVNYQSNTITLADSISRKPGDSVWLYRNSSGEQMLVGTAPDAGATEYGSEPVLNLNLPQITVVTAGPNSTGFGLSVLSATGAPSTTVSNSLPQNTFQNQTPIPVINASTTASANELLIPTTPAVTVPNSPLIPESLVDLPYGTRSSSVLSLQNDLIQYGYLASGLDTGYYGSLTQAAVMKYETAAGYASAGSTAAVPVSSSPASASTIPSFTRTLSFGMTGQDVKNLQIFLNTYGFTVALSGGGSKGNETTYFGPATKTALIRFQDVYAAEILKPYGLTEGTGIFGVETRREVGEILNE